MRGAMKYFLKKLLGHEVYDLLGYENFFEKFVKPSGPPPTYLMYGPLLTMYVYETAAFTFEVRFSTSTYDAR